MSVLLKTRLTAYNLAQMLHVVSLQDTEGGKFDVLDASTESATDNRFLQSLKNTAFSSSLVACVIDGSQAVET